MAKKLKESRVVASAFPCSYPLCQKPHEVTVDVCTRRLREPPTRSPHPHPHLPRLCAEHNRAVNFGSELLRRTLGGDPIYPFGGLYVNVWPVPRPPPAAVE